LVRMNNRQIGTLGEEIAVSDLQLKGMKILERNFRCRFGEIDIIAQMHDVVIFVEVKTRRSRKCGLPEESVDYRKQRRLRLLAGYYLAKHNSLPNVYRFDVYAINLDRENRLVSVRVLENCF